MDLKRVFETIDRGKLIEVVQGYGIGGTVLNWLNSYISGKLDASDSVQGISIFDSSGRS